MKRSYLLPALLQRLAWGPLRVFFYIRGLRITGSEHVESLNGPCIIASNHISELDPLLLVASLPFWSRHLPLIYVAREKDFYAEGWRRLFYGGLFFRIMGAYPAFSGTENYDGALPYHIEALTRGRSVVIFPMGRIHPLPNQPLIAKGGVVYLAHTMCMPIIRVHLTGLEGSGKRRWLKRSITVRFDPPVQPNNLHLTESPSRIDHERVARLLMTNQAGFDSDFSTGVVSAGTALVSPKRSMSKMT
jgi:1-acyl-sn-glycerol-3-phosphate acyltransferase